MKERYSIRVRRGEEIIGEYRFNATPQGLEQLAANIKPDLQYDILGMNGIVSPPVPASNGACIEPDLRDSFETTLSARVVVTVAIHPYFGEHCYIVRSRAGHKFNLLCEVIGQPECRAWFAAYELTDERHFDGRKDF